MLLPLICAAQMSAADEVTLLAFGDSLTQGYGLPPEQGFVPQLEQWLHERNVAVTIINGGVSGDTTAGGAGRIEWSLTDEIDAVIVALGGNDMLRGLPVSEARQNLDTILRKITERGLPILLVGMLAPGNFGTEYKVEFDAIYGDLAVEYKTKYYEYFLQALEDIGDREKVLREYMQKDAVHPNEAGVTRIVEQIAPHVIALIKDIH